MLQRRDPEAHDIDAVIGITGRNVDGTSEASALAAYPGKLEVACGFNRIDNAIGDFLMNIEL